MINKETIKETIMKTIMETTITGFNQEKGEPDYWLDAVRDFWADTGLNTDSMDLEAIVQWFDRRRLEISHMRVSFENGTVLQDDPVSPPITSEVLRHRWGWLMDFWVESIDIVEGTAEVVVSGPG